MDADRLRFCRGNRANSEEQGVQKKGSSEKSGGRKDLNAETAEKRKGQEKLKAGKGTADFR